MAEGSFSGEKGNDNTLNSGNRGITASTLISGADKLIEINEEEF